MERTVELPPLVVGAAETIGGVLGTARLAVGRGLRSMLAGDAPVVRDLDAPIVGDPGLFGPDSVTWRIHADGSMLVGGIRSLLVQMMHPLAMAGVAEHSDYRRNPDRRLVRTAQFVATTTFGTTAQAEEAFAMVERAHRHVVGTAPDGRPYSASDPHLVAWVHHAEVDSFLRAYRRYGAEPLSAADADRYVAEMAVVCERLGGEAPARSVDELDDWMDSVRPELHGTAQSREAARWLLRAPVPLAARPGFAVLAPAAVGLLPPWMRRELDLPFADLLDPVIEPLVIRPAAYALLRTLAWAIEGAIEDALLDEAPAA